MNTRQADKKFFGRSQDPDTFEIRQARGSELIAANGKKYIDLLMGWAVGNLGWDNKEIESEISKFDGPEYVHPQLLYKPWAELAAILAEITPGQLEVSYRCTGGTESVEAAMQIAMLYTGRKKFLSLEGSYHGNSLAAISIGESASAKKFPSVLNGCLKLRPPLTRESLKQAEKLLAKKDIAALFMEPVACNLGVEVHDRAVITELRRLCKRYGTLFVADEVATAFGRTGTLFACEHYGLEPDILCMAKAISGGYGGLGATITTARIAKKVNKTLNIYSTFGWHPRAVHATLANIRYLLKNRKAILEHVAYMEAFFANRLNELKFRYQAEVKIKGLAIGIDVKNEKYAAQIRKNALQNGLYLSSEGTGITFFPALNIAEKTAEEGLRRLRRSI